MESDIVERLRYKLPLYATYSGMTVDLKQAIEEIERLRKERDEAMVLIETIAHDIDVLSTRPADIIKLNDLVFHINEWGDAARKIFSNKENTND